MLRKLQFIFFTCQKLILAHFCKLLYKDRDLWWPNKYRVACFSQFFPAEVKKILRKSQPQICEKLRKLSLRKKSVFLIKTKRVCKVYHKSNKGNKHYGVAIAIESIIAEFSVISNRICKIIIKIGTKESRKKL